MEYAVLVKSCALPKTAVQGELKDITCIYPPFLHEYNMAQGQFLRV